MKILPLQKDLLTHMFKGGRTIMQEEGDSVLVGDGHALWKIPKDQYFLRMEGEKFNFARMLDCDYSRQIYDRGERLVVGNSTTMIMRDEKGIETRVDEALIKHFENPEFFQEGQNDPIRVTENGEIVGVIMPIWINQ